MGFHRLQFCRRLSGLVIASVVLAAPTASAQLRIVDYNTQTGFPGFETAPPEMATIFQAIEAQSVNGIARPIDVLLLQEQFAPETSTQSFVNLLNGIYGPGVYARSNLQAITSDSQGRAGGPTLVYNTQTVTFVAETRFGIVNGTNQARSSMRYRLRPLGYDTAADFYAYNNHYKADGDDLISDRARRQIEAQGVRNNSNALGEGVHAIYAGDYNVQTSAEQMFQTLLGPGAGQAFDPINASGTPPEVVLWRDTIAYRGIHTQDPGGAMDDRFDFQLVTGEMLDGEGMSYITGSYRAFGNNNTHVMNQNITTGSGASPAVLTALSTASDHLPVVVDYQIPARLGVDVAAIPSFVELGAIVSIPVTITNTAPTTLALGADELDYSIAAMGDLAGGAAGVELAGGGGDVVQLMLTTASLGPKSGSIHVETSSQQAAMAVFDQAVGYTVIAAFLAADFDKDGAVNGDDLAAWTTNSGLETGAQKAQGDADNDGDVDGGDFLAWQQQVGQLPLGVEALAAVPEPAAGVLGLVAAAIVGSVRRRRFSPGLCPGVGAASERVAESRVV